jgi:hypothetical protein
MNSIYSKNLSIHQLCDQATKNLHFFWNIKLLITFLASWSNYQCFINLYSFIQASHHWDHIIAIATVSPLPFQSACPFFNLRYYMFGTLICIVIYPNLIKLISSLILLSFNHQNPQGGLDALSISPFSVIDDNTIKVYKWLIKIRFWILWYSKLPLSMCIESTSYFWLQTPNAHTKLECWNSLYILASVGWKGVNMITVMHTP